ncbi:MAG: MBL fold metallo-hydrolase [Prolixibacteraceae bacterium]|nr:MBL fold metallo-hydrolase [Prolixibacteraceae bacterium]MBN2775288.1 MBL fold metallo-hydrolase [Prolixibacteraceae bacterium]
MKKLLTVLTLFVLIFVVNLNSFCQDDLFIIVYNNMASETELESDWGFAAWIELDGKVYLFDTGTKGEVLISNLKKLNLDPALIEKVIISHNHFDHIGGLPAMAAELKPNTVVYLPEKLNDQVAGQIKSLDLKVETGFTKIADKLWITEVMENPANRIKEHTLVIENGDKYIIMTGCAHPGIVSICESIVNHFPEKIPELVTGGFHLVSTGDQEVEKISERLKELGIQKAGASHCTGDKAVEIFKKDWGENYIQLFLGDKYIF